MKADFFWHLIWNDAIIDIREQYPLLPIAEAESIARELGYEYPREPGENSRHVMTTDFLITVDRQDEKNVVARHVKYEKDLSKTRNLEKFEIERRFWETRGIELKVVTERSFDRRMARDIAFLMGHYSPLPQLGDQSKLFDIHEQIRELLVPTLKYHQLSSLMMRVDRKLDLPPGTTLSVFFHLASHKEIPLQMRHELSGTMYLNEIIDWEKYGNQQKEVNRHANYA